MEHFYDNIFNHSTHIGSEWQTWYMHPISFSHLKLHKKKFIRYFAFTLMSRIVFWSLAPPLLGIYIFFPQYYMKRGLAKTCRQVMQEIMNGIQYKSKIKTCGVLDTEQPML